MANVTRFPETNDQVTQGSFQELGGVQQRDYVVSGYEVASTSNLDVNVSDGEAHIAGFHITEASTESVTVSGGTKNFIYVNSDGSKTINQSLGQQPSDSLFIASASATTGGVTATEDERITVPSADDLSQISGTDGDVFRKSDSAPDGVDAFSLNEGSLKFLSSTTPSSAAQIDVTGVGDGPREYIITFAGVEHGASSPPPLRLFMSSDSGATFISGASDYASATHEIAGGSDAVTANEGDNLRVAINIGPSEPFGGRVHFHQTGVSGSNIPVDSTFTSVSGGAAVLDNAGGIFKGSAAGKKPAINALRFEMGNGNFSNGTVAVFERVAS